jgi:hypothetical protein
MIASTSHDHEDMISALKEAVPNGAGEMTVVDEGGVSALSHAAHTCVVLSTPVGQLDDALGTLRKIRRALTPSGTVLCVVENFTGHDMLVQLIRSDPHSIPRSERVHGYATALKLLLEAGVSAGIASAHGSEPDEALLSSAEPLLAHLGVDRARAARHLSASFYVLVGRPVADIDVDEAAVDVAPLTFVACVNDELQLNNNLLASPPLSAGSPHELLTFRGMSSAAQGLNQGINAATHDLVVLIQQDIYIPSWWPARLVRQWKLADEQGPVAIGGPVGVRYRQGGRTHVGHAVDRESVFRQDVPLPAVVDGLDELTLVVARDVPLRFEPALGWHLYGADFALQARKEGLKSVALDVPCMHNSLHSAIDDAFHHSASILAAKWPRELPIFTNTTQIDEDPRDAAMRSMSMELDALRRQLRIARNEAEVSRERDVAPVPRWRPWRRRSRD